MTSRDPINVRGGNGRGEAGRVSYSLILFDLDGTLTDSGVGIANSVAHALAALGMEPLTGLTLRGFIGPPLQQSFAALGLSRVDVRKAVESYRDYFLDTGLYQNEPYEGVDALLTGLRARGCRLTVATSKPTPFALRILDHFALAQYFEHVQGSELDGTRSQKHEVITEALTCVGPQPLGSAIMVGDRAQDVRGAAHVGIPCVGAGWGYAVEGELESAGADPILTTPAELFSYLFGAVGA